VFWECGKVRRSRYGQSDNNRGNLASDHNLIRRRIYSFSQTRVFRSSLLELKLVDHKLSPSKNLSFIFCVFATPVLSFCLWQLPCSISDLSPSDVRRSFSCETEGTVFILIDWIYENENIVNVFQKKISSRIFIKIQKCYFYILI